MNKNNYLKDTSITVATYNILFSINTREIVKNIIAMANEGVMIFCLQEVIKTKNTNFIIDDILAKLGKNWKAFSNLGDDGTILDFGTCILWNNDFLQVEQIEKVSLPKVNRLAIHEFLFDKLLGHKGIPVQRRAINGLFIFQNTPILITNVHFDNVGGKKNRLNQLHYLLKRIKKRNEVTHQILCGDFNSFDLLKTGAEKRELQRTLGNEFIDASEDIPWTADINNTVLPQKSSFFLSFIRVIHLHIQRKLDYIWVKNFQIQECKKVVLSGSDHYPLIATLKLMQ